MRWLVTCDTFLRLNAKIHLVDEALGRLGDDDIDGYDGALKVISRIAKSTELSMVLTLKDVGIVQR